MSEWEGHAGRVCIAGVPLVTRLGKTSTGDKPRISCGSGMDLSRTLDTVARRKKTKASERVVTRH